MTSTISVEYQREVSFEFSKASGSETSPACGCQFRPNGTSGIGLASPKVSYESATVNHPVAQPDIVLRAGTLISRHRPSFDFEVEIYDASGVEVGGLETIEDVLTSVDDSRKVISIDSAYQMRLVEAEEPMFFSGERFPYFGYLPAKQSNISLDFGTGTRRIQLIDRLDPMPEADEFLNREILVVPSLEQSSRTTALAQIRRLDTHPTLEIVGTEVAIYARSLASFRNENGFESANNFADHPIIIVMRPPFSMSAKILDQSPRRWEMGDLISWTPVLPSEEYLATMLQTSDGLKAIIDFAYVDLDAEPSREAFSIDDLAAFRSDSVHTRLNVSLLDTSSLSFQGMLGQPGDMFAARLASFVDLLTVPVQYRFPDLSATSPISVWGPLNSFKVLGASGELQSFGYNAEFAADFADGLLVSTEEISGYESLDITAEGSFSVIVPSATIEINGQSARPWTSRLGPLLSILTLFSVAGTLLSFILSFGSRTER